MNELKAMGAHFFDSWFEDMDSSRKRVERRIEITMVTAGPGVNELGVTHGSGPFKSFNFACSPEKLREVAEHLLMVASHAETLEVSND